MKVARANPTALLLTATPNPTYAEPVTFVATVTSSGGPIPDGELVTFYDGTTVLGTGATAKGVASLASMLAPRVHYIKAVYPGDSTFNSSTDAVKEQAFGQQTEAALNVWPNPLIYGQATTLLAMVYPRTFPHGPPYPAGPVGTVKFKYNGNTIGTATLQDTLLFMGYSSAKFTTSSLNAGSFPIEVVYSGDSTYAPSTSSAVDLVVQQATTASTLTSSLNPSTAGQPITLTFTVASPTVVPKGPVTFWLGQTALGVAQLKGGVAKLTISSLTAGRNWIKATYGGNSNVASTKASVTQVVQ